MATPQPQPPPMKRFCPTGGGSYCSNSCNCSRNKETFFAAGRGPGFGNGIFNTGAPVQTSSAFASGESKVRLWFNRLIRSYHSDSYTLKILSDSTSHRACESTRSQIWEWWRMDKLHLVIFLVFINQNQNGLHQKRWE